MGYDSVATIRTSALDRIAKRGISKEFGKALDNACMLGSMGRDPVVHNPRKPGDSLGQWRGIFDADNPNRLTLDFTNESDEDELIVLLWHDVMDFAVQDKSFGTRFVSMAERFQEGYPRTQNSPVAMGVTAQGDYGSGQMLRFCGIAKPGEKVEIMVFHGAVEQLRIGCEGVAARVNYKGGKLEYPVGCMPS